MPASSTNRRRWFQIGLVEFLILTTLLGIICWQAAARPVIVRQGPASFPLAGGGTISFDWLEERIDPPPLDSVMYRIAIGSMIVVAVWLAAKTAIRAVTRKTEP